tara:strand:- start:648 stop:2096 length:1449 start_codon:yes stop_codon:yes gene_type:complete
VELILNYIPKHLNSIFVSGKWKNINSARKTFSVENPSNKEKICNISFANRDDCDQAILSAKEAFNSFSETTINERIDFLKDIKQKFLERYEDFAQIMTAEMGAPIKFSRDEQVSSADMHFDATINAAKTFDWEKKYENSRVIKEAIGVAVMITPWNWPLNQIVCKVAPAIISGCTMVLKPSELSPLSALLFSEVIESSNLPDGVFNMVNGSGEDIGNYLSSHPNVDMVSFTGSTKAGISVAKAASDTVKRVTQELGGKSPNIILETANIEKAVKSGVEACFSNAGQSCDAPSRMLVPKKSFLNAIEIAKVRAEQFKVGNPLDENTDIGPVISKTHYLKIQNYIKSGIDEGASLVTGGMGYPKGKNEGYFVKPTIFTNVKYNMKIFNEEIFGTVLVILPYDNEEEAINIANNTKYGLAAFVQGELNHARKIARKLKAGQIHINYPSWDVTVPFGGYKQSGNGHEYGAWGIDDYCEYKSIVGYN